MSNLAGPGRQEAGDRRYCVDRATVGLSASTCGPAPALHTELFLLLVRQGTWLNSMALLFNTPHKKYSENTLRLAVMLVK